MDAAERKGKGRRAPWVSCSLILVSAAAVDVQVTHPTQGVSAALHLGLAGTREKNSDGGSRGQVLPKPSALHIFARAQRDSGCSPGLAGDVSSLIGSTAYRGLVVVVV